MERTTLGRTGLSVSVAGLGCGGHSRLGQSQGKSVKHSVSVVRAAIDTGVNFFDTAAAYRTEEIVGKAVQNCRDKVVISSKLGVIRPGTDHLGQDFLTADEFVELAEQNLSRLNTDYIDIFHLHGVMPNQYEYCRAELVPALEKLREDGKIRFFGLTERFIHDTAHTMLQRALSDDFWDVVMTGFNMINPSARHRVFSQTRAQGVGTLVMFAVRRALSSPDATAALIGDLIARGEIEQVGLEPDTPLAFLTETGGASSVIEAAYRFCRHEAGADVVLTGTGEPAHLRDNLTALSKPPLAPELLRKLEAHFGQVDSVSGN